MPRAEQLTGPDSTHGEGPVFAAAWGGLRWVDMLAGDVLHLNAVDGQVSRWHVGTVAAALRPRSGGGAVIATERHFLGCDQLGGALHILGAPFTSSAIRFNDGACDPAGNFLCGTMAYDETPGAGHLYRLGIDGSVEVVLDGLTISNGLAWTADHQLAYYNDTPTGQIDVFDSDSTGRLSNRRRFVSIEAADGFPDGLSVDAAGGVWVALWGGSAVRHYSAAGTLADVIELPVPNVTACTFGGENLDELYITTSRRNKGNRRNTGAGAVYRYHPGVTGQPVTEFAG